MAIKFYGGHQLNSKAKVYGTRQDFEVIEVDENGDPITEASAYFLTRSISGSPRTLYLRPTDDIDSVTTTLSNTASTFGVNHNMAVHPSGQYIAVPDHKGYSGGDPVVFVYDTQDLSAPLATLSPDAGEATYGQPYQFGYSMAMSDTKLFVGNDAQGVPVYCYDLSDLSAAPNKISTPTSYHNGDFKFSSDMAANSTHLFIGHSQCRNPLTSNDNQTEAGAVHVYDVTTLQYQTTVYGFNPEYGDYFGSEVKATDTHLVVGAYGDDEVHGNQNQNGAVYVFDATDLSASPTKVMPLTSGHSDQFGRAISLSDTHLAVGEPSDNTNNSDSGALHIYDLNNLSNPSISYGTLHSEYYGSNPHLFNDGSNRISFYRSFANIGQPAKYFVYNISDLTTPLWESETEMPYAFLPAYTRVTPASQVSLHLNGTASGIVDSSSNSHAVTISGDVSVVAESPYGTGKSITFDGSNDQVSFSHEGFGTGDFTVEGWVYPESQPQRYPLVFTIGDAFSVQYDHVDVPNKFRILTPSVTSTGNNNLHSATDNATNQWYHIAAVRSNGTLTMYIDGSAVASVTYTNNLSATTQFIGGNGAVSGELAFKGQVADVRYTKAAVYTENFSVPTATLGDYPPPPVRYYKTLATQYVPPPPPPPPLYNATVDDWGSLLGASLSEPTPGTIRFVRTRDGNDSEVGYYEFTGLTANQDYKIDIEYRVVTGSTFTVNLQRGYNSGLLGTVSTSDTSFQSTSETWTQNSADNGKFYIKVEVTSATNHSGEIRSITLTEV